MAELPRAPHLLLASASPRRRTLLAAAGYPLTLVRTDVTESEAPYLTASERVRFNARIKAAAGCRTVDPASSLTLVLGADTLVSLGAEILGKPASLGEAFRMVSSLAGRTHEVYTGVCLLRAGTGTGMGSVAGEFVERTAVTFRSLNADAIRAYLARIDPLDKAGGYAAQEHGADIIASVDGSWTNVLGLPMETLTTSLARLGVRPNGTLSGNFRAGC